jgi:hypothetical protein
MRRAVHLFVRQNPPPPQAHRISKRVPVPESFRYQLDIKNVNSLDFRHSCRLTSARDWIEPSRWESRSIAAKADRSRIAGQLDSKEACLGEGVKCPFYPKARQRPVRQSTAPDNKNSVNTSGVSSKSIPWNWRMAVITAGKL